MQFARPYPFYISCGRRGDPPMALLALTNPMPPERVEALLLRDAAIEQGELGREERTAYLTETLHHLAFEIEGRIRGGAGEGIRLLLILTFLSLLSVCGCAWGAGSPWRWMFVVMAAGSLLLLIRHEVAGRVRSRESIVGCLLARARLADAADPALLGDALLALAGEGAEWAGRLKPERIARRISDAISRREGVSAESPFKAAGALDHRARAA